jgi:hypothetical protein
VPERNDGGAPDVSEPRPGARPFALLAAAPDKGLREKQMRAMMAEAKRRAEAREAAAEAESHGRPRAATHLRAGPRRIRRELRPGPAWVHRCCQFRLRGGCAAR